MKTFQAAEWDTDATGDNTYQELFQKSKSRKKKDKSKFLAGKVEKDKNQKVKLKKLLKQKYSDLKSSQDSNLTNAQTNPEELTKSKKKRMKKRRKLERNNIEQRKIEQCLESLNQKTKKVKGKLKKSKASVACELDDVENGVTKEQTKMLKKYASELNSLNSHSDELSNELLREKKRQKKLQKKLEKARKKERLLSKAIETTKKSKFSSEKAKKTNHKQKKSLDATEIICLDSDTDSDPNDKKKKKEKKKQYMNESLHPEEKNGQMKNIPESSSKMKKRKLQEKLKTILSEAKNNKPIISLRQKMMEKLKAARFRFLNEQIYTTDSKEAQKIFKSDPEAFNAYHEGYRQQVKGWPLNPLDVIIKSIQNMPKSHTIADFGCGDAKLAKSVRQKVHSFDLVAVNDNVVACDMAKVPLEDGSVDVAVFCLSLMGTNLHDYLLEANRVLRIGGILKIAEVESRFDDVENFIEGVQRFGFKKTWKDLSHNLFYFLDFKKINNIKNKKKLPTISLLPCLYKKR